MSAALLETLPLVQRLALAYAARAVRGDALALLALDARLAGIVRGDGEPVIAQMKLAWWRERLAQDPQDWPLGEPLLALLRQGQLATSALAPLVDGWEALLAEQLDDSIVESFATGRVALWQVLADAHGGGGNHAVQAAREHAITDLALNLGTAEEASLARDLAQAQPWSSPALARPLRPLAILHGLSHRALKRDANDLLDGPGAMVTVLRLGILGR
jgi:phytoene synthase